MKLILENNINDKIDMLKKAFRLSDYDVNILVFEYIRYGIKSSMLFAVMKHHGYLVDNRYVHPDNEYVRALQSSIDKIEDELRMHGIVGSYLKHVVRISITKESITLELS